MAGAAGLEPVTSAVTGQRSNQLSYAPARGRRTYEMGPPPSRGTEQNAAVLFLGPTGSLSEQGAC